MRHLFVFAALLSLAACEEPDTTDTGTPTCWDPSTVVVIDCEGGGATLVGPSTPEGVIAVYLCSEAGGAEHCQLAPEMSFGDDSATVTCADGDWARFAWTQPKPD